MNITTHNEPDFIREWCFHMFEVQKEQVLHLEKKQQAENAFLKMGILF